MPIKKVEISVPIIAKLTMLFTEDFISLKLTCSEPAKSKKLKSIPSRNSEKFIVKSPCFIEFVKSTDNWPANINTIETIVPMSINPIPDGNFNTQKLMYEKIAAREIKTENKKIAAFNEV